jgi:molecular chaperone DnaJ
VRIPAGVDEGTSLRVAGGGDVGDRGAQSGDLYVVIHLKGDPLFKRHNDDLLTDLDVSFPQAVFGGEFDVKTLDGRLRLKVPGGTQPGTVFRIRGEGFPEVGASHRGVRGDLLVKANIVVPKNLNEKQKVLLRQYAQAFIEPGSGGTPGDDSIFKRVFKK